MEKATSEQSQILGNVNVNFDKKKAYDELYQAEKAYKNASSSNSAAWSRCKKLQAKLREAIAGEYVTESLRTEIEKAGKRHDITSERKSKAKIAKSEAYIYYHTQGQARTRAEQIAYLEKYQEEIRAYIAKESGN